MTRYIVSWKDAGLDRRAMFAFAPAALDKWRELCLAEFDPTGATYGYNWGCKYQSVTAATLVYLGPDGERFVS